MDYVAALKHFDGPRHLYLHIPFCAKLCHYCICNISITNDRAKIQFFLDHLLKEIDLLRPFHPQIRDLHFGGGTPSHLDRTQFSQLCASLNKLVPLKSLSEVAMEIDPRTVKKGDLEHYASEGVNRISFGVQDFDPDVQLAINRVQPFEMVEEVLEDRHFFKGVNFDLLYGLPKQTLETVEKTLTQVIQLNPERITLLKYCHAPELRRHMKLIKEADLPSPDELPVMFVTMTEKLVEAGYQWVGLDHFCLSTDSLSKKIGRTFNGFSSGTTEMIGLGPTSTGVFGTIYCQNTYDLAEYYNAVNRGEFPILRGYRMSADDLMRRGVIFSLLCHQRVDLSGYGDYFDRELEILSGMPELIRIERGLVTVTGYGRVLLRNICKVFDVKDTQPEHYRIAQRTITRRAA